MDKLEQLMITILVNIIKELAIWQLLSFQLFRLKFKQEMDKFKPNKIYSEMPQAI
jgi:hypothetical protein